MKNVQIKGVNSTLSQVVLDDIQYLKQHLDNLFLNSDRTLISNLISETEYLLNKVESSSETYKEKYDKFSQLTETWFDLWRRYRDIPEALELIKLIDHLTNFSVAYSYLFRSLSLINEGRTGEDKTDLERIVSGFLFLSEIIDVFIEFFSIAELDQICDGARNAISISARNVKKYFEDDLELSNLITQLKAYSSLIIFRVQGHLNSLKEIENSDEISVDIDSESCANQLNAYTNQLRPFGLCARDFKVPDNFDEPLPEEILSTFEGQ